MPHLSRHDVDATHSLFVLDRPDMPTRFLFVSERSGETTTYQAHVGTSGATVARQPDGDYIHLNLTLSTRNVLRQTGMGRWSSITPGATPDEWNVSTDEGTWSVAFEAEARVVVTSPSAGVCVTAQTNVEDFGGRSSTFDVWAQGRPVCETTAFQILVEALVLQRLLPVFDPEPRR